MAVASLEGLAGAATSCSVTLAFLLMAASSAAPPASNSQLLGEAGAWGAG